MYTFRECSKGFVVVGKILPAQGNQESNRVWMGFGAYMAKIFQRLFLSNGESYRLEKQFV